MCKMDMIFHKETFAQTGRKGKMNGISQNMSWAMKHVRSEVYDYWRQEPTLL